MKTTNLKQAIIVCAMVLADAAMAQTFTNLYSFTAGSYPSGTNSDGALPASGLILSGNTLYGTALEGGVGGAGTVFKINTDGTGFTTLHSFTALKNETNSDGGHPYGELIVAGNTLYGTTENGGTGKGAGEGTVFKVNTDGTGFTTLHILVYDHTNGFFPQGGLILSGNTLYGTTLRGGTGEGVGEGTVFKVNTDGTGFRTLYSFTGGSDEGYPSGELILSGNTLYGTALGSYDSDFGDGTVFAINTDGTGFTTLYSFTGGSDGAAPSAGLILSGNTLYGTAEGGGSSGAGTVFAVNTDGTGFTTLYSFTGGSDGEYPLSPLILSGNTLYGTTENGGTSNYGTVFMINTDGTGFTTLYSFPGGSNGEYANGPLVLSGGKMYGAAEYGGSLGDGTLFILLPTVQYAANPTSGGVPLTVQFNCPGVDSLGNAITQWNWNFGDGATNTAQNPSHTYTNVATFSPTLIATNNFGVMVPGSGPSILAGQLVLNGGFETGDFTGWTLSGDTSNTFVDNGSVMPPHSGNYEAALETVSSLGYLSQTLATTPGASYLLSFWIDNPYGDPGMFSVSWNGNTLLDETNPVANAWANIQFVVSATGTNTLLQFGFQDNYDFLGLDDVSVVPAGQASPVITWTAPAAIGYGTALSGTQLNASANVPGSFAYTPTNGTVLEAGTNTLSVIFTPTDTVDYSIATDSVSLVVLPAALTVTANDTNSVYGQTNPVFSGSITGVTNGDNITVTFVSSATTNTPVGGYAIVPVLADPGNRLSNYNVTTNTGTLMVNPAPLTVTASAQSKTYGQTLAFGSGSTQFTSSGLQNGETIGSVTLAVSGNGGAATAPPGTYTITPSLATGGIFNANNYAITYNTGTLTVNPATPPTITSITPNTGPTNGGTLTTITGTGFETGASVSFGPSPAASVTVNSSTNLTAVTPAGLAGVVNVVITNADGNVTTFTNGFTYISNALTAYTFTTLYNFSFFKYDIDVGEYTNSDGAQPEAGLILSSNTLYGTAEGGGTNGSGTVFKVNTDGSGSTTLYSFSSLPASSGYPLINSDGANPYAGLILSGNTLYGTAVNGGTNGNGTVFSVNADGTGFTTLYNFSATVYVYPTYLNSDGANPYAGLILSGYTLYGTTAAGGTNGNGTVFKVNTDGSGFTTLYNFSAAPAPSYTNSDGANPYAGLILSGDTLYGTAVNGGTNGSGTVFAVNTDGSSFTTLYSFSAISGYPFINSDGVAPYGGLILSGNTLYGTTAAGGTNGNGTLFKVNTDGTGFSSLYNFSATPGPSYINSDGAQPEAGLILSGNTLYGTAEGGGTNGNGTVFKVNTDGSGFTTLYSFSATAQLYGGLVNSDGANPYAGLILSGNTLYGTAVNGGTNGNGTVFALSLAAAVPVSIPLNIQLISNGVVLSWNDPASAFSLQSAPAVTGTFTNIPGATSPYTNPVTGAQQFFRLMQ